jgi:hypothetical protein
MSDDFPATTTVSVKPYYRLKHWLLDIALALSGLAGIILPLTDPLPGFTPEAWRWVSFTALAITTLFKLHQTNSGATTGAAPKV